MTQTVLSVFGTRPEAIKMAPVIRELASHPNEVRSVVCVTAQHRQMLDQVLELFQIEPDYDLDLMTEQQSLTGLTARALASLDPVLDQVKPDWVLVQGDTTTVMAVSLAAFYHQLPVAHIEAGLRTHDKRAPFPEEINRRITSVLADRHFAPTQRARQALLAEGVPNASIQVTGNTVIDALIWMRDQVRRAPPDLPPGVSEALDGKRLILVTGHRRESFGPGLERVCLALRDIAEQHPDVCLIYPVHLNPKVRETVFQFLGGVERIQLIEPLPYAPFVRLMDQATLILTDSGGIQEEAPALGKPVLVLRDTTERPEGIEAGNALLVGTTREQIVAQTHRLLTQPDAYQAMATAHNPYGDGQAAVRIVQSLLRTR
jgi:UDP-N-acetylglucosamine 2-epimerase (non-hydrolysing)